MGRFPIPQNERSIGALLIFSAIVTFYFSYVVICSTRSDWILFNMNTKIKTIHPLSMVSILWRVEWDWRYIYSPGCTLHRIDKYYYMCYNLKKCMGKKLIMTRFFWGHQSKMTLLLPGTIKVISTQLSLLEVLHNIRTECQLLLTYPKTESVQ